MTWVQTYSGQVFTPLDPRPEQITVIDIAHALSNLCRFTGHTWRFYSVAQHSVLCSDNCPEYPREALLHDAAEAYINDLAHPVKMELPIYGRIERKILKAIFKRFELQWPIPGAVHDVDARLLMTEQRDLMGPQSQPWSCIAQPFDVTIDPMDPTTACIMFLDRFSKLFPVGW